MADTYPTDAPIARFFSPTDRREKIYCDCCGKQVLAYREGDRIIINARRFGRMHTAVITLPRQRLDRPLRPDDTLERK